MYFLEIVFLLFIYCALPFFACGSNRALISANGLFFEKCRNLSRLISSVLRIFKVTMATIVY